MNTKYFTIPNIVRSFTGALLFALTACAGLPEALPEPFVRLSRTESIPAFERKKPSADLKLSLIDVSQPGTLQILVRNLLYKGQDAEAYAGKITGDLTRDYRETATENPEYTTNWSYDEAQKLALAGSYAVITRLISSYTGGAHGNWTETSYVLDQEKPRQIRLADLITRAGFPNLYAFADRELRDFSAAAGQPLPPGTPLSNGIFFEDSVTLSEDFYPTKEGLNFQWDPYEIAPYSEGGVEITLTWQELADILSAEGKKLAAAFAD
jgi:hypothetical protein